MIKFLPLDFLAVSHNILWKNENAVYHLQIPALVPKIFKFEKCVKYANEMYEAKRLQGWYYVKNVEQEPIKQDRNSGQLFRSCWSSSTLCSEDM